jgi:MoaA/NifB/PqqE/SkfB family radical SAM enzyme
MAKKISIIAKAFKAIRGTSVPLVTSLVVTDRYPEKYKTASDPNALADLPTEELTATIDRLYEAGTMKLFILGGEPLLRGDIKTLVDHGAGLGMQVFLYTTGFALSDQVDALKNTHAVIIELNGPKDFHDSIRGPGTFDTALKGARAAKDAGLNVKLLALAAKGAEEVLDPLLDIARELDVKVSFQPATTHSAQGVAEPMLPDDQLAFFKRLLKKRRAKEPLGNLKGSLKYFAGKCSMPLCWGGRIFCHIETGGRVMVCSNHRASVVKWQPDHPFADALDRLDTSGCRQCHSAANISINSAMAFRLPTLLDILKEL